VHDYQRRFIEFALEHEVLKFGSFTLKSGRTSPYFFNAGGFNTGARLDALGGFYADAIAQSQVAFDVLLGPAYKGIPLAAATAVKLATEHGLDVPWCFNRKEVKDHGEGGLFVGAEPKGRLLVIDDVITAGTAIREVIELVANLAAEVAAVMVAVDRRERGTGELSAIQEVERDYAISVYSIVNFDHIIEYLEQTGRYGEHLPAVREYRDRYGVS